MLHIDLTAIREGKTNFTEQVKDIKHSNLRAETAEIFSSIQSIITGATDADVVFVPHDEHSQEGDEHGWTLAHVIAHVTAGLEEGASRSALLARGVLLEGRQRYETPWERITTIAQLQARIKESQRICNAYLDAWPDDPHLDLTMTLVPAFGPMNAIASYSLSLGHAYAHFAQLREIMRQSKQAA